MKNQMYFEQERLFGVFWVKIKNTFDRDGSLRSPPLKTMKKRKSIHFDMLRTTISIIVILFLCLGIKQINCYAETTEDLNFKITNLRGEEMEVTCLNSEKRFYEALNPSISPIWTIDGFMPDGFTSVKVKMAIDTHNTSETYPDLYYSYGELDGKSTFHIDQVSGMFSDEFCKDTHGVFEIIFNNGDGNNISYYIILDGNPHNYTVGTSYQGGEKLIDYFSDSIDLVDPDNNSVFYNVFDKETDSEIYPQRKLYQNVTFTKCIKKTYKTISIPATVKYKGYTFKVTAIAKNACKNNKKATTIVIGKNVQTIGASAFEGDIKLQKITVKSSAIKKVGAKALKKTPKLKTIKVPKKKVKKYTKLFKGKGQKKSVKVK